jgi:hypothetical protein
MKHAWRDYKYIISARKPKVKRRLGRTNCRWEDSTNMDLKEIGCEGVVKVKVKLSLCFN